MASLPFSERILRRHRAWWREATPGVHPPQECFAAVAHDAPDEAWRCCPHWQRKLSNKWNAREFAARHGVATPGLYWHGTDLDTAPWDDLPEAWVARPNVGYSNHGIQAIVRGRDMITRRRRSPAAARRRMADYLAAHPYEHLIYMLEEYVRDEGAHFGRPLNYKVHTFAGTVGAVQVNTAHGLRGWLRRRNRVSTNLYTPDWQPIEYDFAPNRPRGPWRDPPRCLEALLDAAATLGRAYGTYCCIDFYATDAGPRLAEFTPTPRRGGSLTEFTEDFLGGLWDRHCPDAL